MAAIAHEDVILSAAKNPEGVGAANAIRGKNVAVRNGERCMICWPQGLIENWPAVLEAVATLLLVIAAGFQWWTMRGQAQQERDRWQREDEIRAEENRPKAEFWFENNGGVCELNCSNLGSVGFFVWQLGIQPVVHNEMNWHTQPTLRHIKVEKFVPIGQNHTIKIYSLGSNLQYFGSNYEFILYLSNPQGTKSEIRKPFHKWKSTGLETIIETGFVDYVVSKCPKCNASCDSILVGDLKSADEIQQRLDAIHQEYRQTCPAHTTTSDKVYVMPPPPSDAPRYDG